MTPAELCLVGGLFAGRGREDLRAYEIMGWSEDTFSDPLALEVWRCAKKLDGETAGNWNGVELFARVYNVFFDIVSEYKRELAAREAMAHGRGMATRILEGGAR